MNWGKGIIIGMGLFMGFIIFLVVNVMTHRVDLQSDDYYKKEIQYEDEILAVKNANELNEQISINAADDFLVVKIPDSLNAQQIKLDLIRPDDKKLDQHLLISDTKTFLLPLKELTEGKYLTELHYLVKEKPFLQKSEVYINR
jgi:hypothetical protein